MDIEHVTDLQALGFIAAVILVSILAFRIIPGTRLPRGNRSYTEAEITAYDRSLPKYFLAAIVALTIGGLHAAVKSIPPAYAWLTEAGHGGHMVRDLANTHLVIVIGGTVAASGLLWYVLPRVARRPLYSNLLATWSFWLTVAGAAGFYVSNVILGLVFGQMNHDGIGYVTAKPMLGALRTIPIALSAGIMGVGYWTFTAEILLTVWAARRVGAPKPHGHLLKFFAIGAIGLLVGTVQGVIQVLPDNETWLHAAGAAGSYIDPIAHAHVNLVTGTLTLVAGFLFWFSTRHGLRPAQRRAENLVFWTMVPGGLAFYATFMVLGWVEGHLITDAGLTYAQAVERLGPWHSMPLMIAGTLTVAGVWGLLLVAVRRYWRGESSGLVGASLVIVSAAALLIGTAQGLIQLLPPVKSFLLAAGESGDAIPNAHAQLNMVGGVIPALLGLAMVEGPTLLGVAVSRDLARRLAVLIGAGVAAYYVSSIGANIVMGQVSASAGAVGPALVAANLGGIGMAVGATIYTLGFATLAVRAWCGTAQYRADGWRDLLASLASHNGEPAAWLPRVPPRYLLGAEATGAIVGFPGLGWILGGVPLIGLPMVLGGPPVAWALLPLLSSPFGSSPLGWLGLWQSVLIYLAASTALSVAGLWITLKVRRGSRSAERSPLAADLRGSEQRL
jgi:hypothetical protein